MATVLTCNFKLADVLFDADVVLYGSPTGDPREFNNLLPSVLASKMKTKVSPESMKIMHLLTQLDLPKETRDAYIGLLLSSVLREPFSLTGIPEVELILADITKIAPAMTMESEIEELNRKRTLDLLKLVTFETQSDYMKFVKNGIAEVSRDSFVANNFFSSCDLSNDKFIAIFSIVNQRDTIIADVQAEIESVEQKPAKLHDDLEKMNSFELSNTADDVESEEPLTFFVLLFISNTLKFMMYCVFFDPIVSILAQFVVVPILVFIFCNRPDF
uniref:WSN domain-containing protein n=1 Tax=Panagrellus redivivus TaxID=6233 RepID=A0A7E4W1E1_PANRE